MTARRLVEDLREALSSCELTCHYQPKISALDGRVHSVEALVRWPHPTRGLLLPDQFLPAAEKAGLMRPVAARVLDLALAQIRSWRDQGIALTVAVNLSTTNLLDVGLVDTIDRLLRTHHCRPTRSSWNSPKAHLRQTRSGPATRSPRCGDSACASRSTTTEPAGRLWPACRICRSMNSNSTRSSSHVWPAIRGPSPSCAPPWHLRTALEPISSPRVLRTSDIAGAAPLRLQYHPGLRPLPASARRSTPAMGDEWSKTC